MANYRTLVNAATAANGNSDDLMRDMLLQLEELLTGETGYSDSLERALEDTYAHDAAALGVDAEEGITDTLMDVIGRASAAQALDALSEEKVDITKASAALAQAIRRRKLWLGAR